MICKKCKESLELKDAILGGYVCPNCGKFNPKKAVKNMLLDTGCDNAKDVGKKIKTLKRDNRFKDKGLEMTKRRRKIKKED